MSAMLVFVADMPPIGVISAIRGVALGDAAAFPAASACAVVGDPFGEALGEAAADHDQDHVHDHDHESLITCAI